MEEIPCLQRLRIVRYIMRQVGMLINFEKGWKHGNCPKLNTLVTYGYEGPI